MPTEILILKHGQLEGPYAEEEVIQKVNAGELGQADLGQTAQSYYWVPLHKLLALPIDGEAAPQPAAPRFWVFVEDIRERAWLVFLHYPLESGLFCLTVGLITALFSFWPLLMYGPWLLASLTAGGMLFLRGRTWAGMALCAAAILVPIILVNLLMH